MAKKYAEFIIKWRYLVTLLTICLVALSSIGIKNLSFTTNYRAFFGKNNPELNAFDKMQNTYNKSDNISIVVEPKDGKVFTLKFLKTIDELTQKAWQIPYSTRVDSLTNYQHTKSNDDDLIVQDLVNLDEELTPEKLEYIKNVALNEPLLINKLISKKAHVTAVNITFELPEESGEAVPLVASKAKELAEEIKINNPDINTYLTGVVMMNNAFAMCSLNDVQTLVPLMFFTVILTLWLLLRSHVGTISTVIVIIMSIITAMGIVGHLGFKLTPPTASAPTIILTMGVADCVHILITYISGMRHGLDRFSAMIDSIRINFQPVFITSITTVVGFLTMNFSEVPPFNDLGNIVALGVSAAFIFAVTFLPAFVVLFPIKVKIINTEQKTYMDKFANFVIKHPTKILATTIITTLILLLCIPINQLNDQFVKYFDKSVQFRVDTDFMSNNLSGIYTMEFSLSQNEESGISKPEYLNNVEKFSNWLREKSYVIHVSTITDTFKRLNKNMHNDDSKWYILPISRELAAQYLLLYEMSLPYGLDLNNQINIEKSASKVTITTKNLTTKETLNIESDIDTYVKNNLHGINITKASPTLMFAHIGKRNVESMLTGTVVALILISLILVFAFKSLRVGIISLLPNLIPGGIAFGIWGIFVGKVGMSLAVVLGMTLGIVVDDTVHFLSKYLRAKREKNLNDIDAVRYAFSTVGVALWVTSVVLVCGFGILALSKFALNSDMGIMTALTIAIALIIDFLFLPALLIKIGGTKNVS